MSREAMKLALEALEEGPINTITRACRAHEAITAQPAKQSLTDEKYNELLLAVGNKYPCETRHETALRYIRQAEMREPAPAKAIEAKLKEKNT